MRQDGHRPGEIGSFIVERSILDEQNIPLFFSTFFIALIACATAFAISDQYQGGFISPVSLSRLTASAP